MPIQTAAKPHFSLLATSFAGGPRPRNAATILFGLWFLLFFAALFSPPILDDADATHANAARAILSTGDLVTLKVNGVRYMEKAPLPFWLAAISFRIFGFNTFAAHLPQALAVLLLMLLAIAGPIRRLARAPVFIPRWRSSPRSESSCSRAS